MLIKTMQLLALSVLMTSAAWAVDRSSAVTSQATLDAWERMAVYEPCMNGDVSSSGFYPSQVGEDKSRATLGLIAKRIGSD